jgi:hypothetical protein
VKPWIEHLVGAINNYYRKLLIGISCPREKACFLLKFFKKNLLSYFYFPVEKQKKKKKENIRFEHFFEKLVYRNAEKKSGTQLSY